ncbi:ATP-binding protein [Saccharospirillum salsuginis]|uniref:ATPase AAA-type core domain-containing protein n=1 Tax=Saccharospirillum salsuginis TaxID=418750 RepID=A0A918KE12_9GAMM|nr:ATP-binding protein [Saccharospirillum salsuginis]GGX59849.1 hypothetical protein GCM10007392_29800 [Saccharospirillum salsuginis]
MSLLLVGVEEYNGFKISAPTRIGDTITVLTGINGSGKTRLLESIRQKATKASINGSDLENSEVLLVEQNKLTPNFSGGYSESNYQITLTSTLQCYDEFKHKFLEPLNPKEQRHINQRFEKSLPYETLYRLCHSIAKKADKSVDQLTHDDIILNFEEQNRQILGVQNISLICNQYIRRKWQNQFNQFIAKTKDNNTPFLTDQEFEIRFGPRPWKSLNNIIDVIFDSKFYFEEPDENSKSYNYNAKLIERKNGNIVNANTLSSGEKTLLWLAITLFNSQYYDPDLIDPPVLLLLDEPDAFLHPKMVVKMYEVFTVFNQQYNTRIIITTHSPTSVALAPEDSVFVVENNNIKKTNKDKGISDLLDGVTQISISPENRRQVFVESKYDADVYQAIYSKISHSSKIIDPKISLNFISSGPKMPGKQIEKKARQFFDINDDSKIKQFIESLNGVGSCSHVIAQVESLQSNDNETIRGIIDWDLTNEHHQCVKVLAPGLAYSIENLALDPICTLLLLAVHHPDYLSMENICTQDVHWSEWINDNELLQRSLDIFVKNITGFENQKDSNIDYISGQTLKTDSGYLKMNGHELEKTLLDKYPRLNQYWKDKKSGQLMHSIVNLSMINISNGKFIPKAFETVFAEVQK